MAEGGWNLAATPQNDLHSSLAPSPPLILAGPTAVGKSEVALRLAETLNGEIVCVDSMQVYRGMDIGTAKQSAAERAYVRHHLVDVVEVTEPFDAAQFVRLASPAVSAIQGRNRVPILCGGTGLYFKAFFEGLGEAPPGDPALRAELEATPLPELLRELAGRDPTTYEKIDRQNPRRIIRAVEVIRLTGKPFSTQRYKVSGCDWIMLKRQKLGGVALAAQLGLDGLEVDMGSLGWWQRRRPCWRADWHKTKRRVSRWAIGRWRNTCAANGRCRRRSSWSKSAPASSPNGK